MCVISTVVSKCVSLLPFLDFFKLLLFQVLVVISNLEPLKLMSIYLFIHLIQILNTVGRLARNLPRLSQNA